MKKLNKLKYSVQAVILNKNNEVLAVSRKNNHNDFGLVGGKVEKSDKSLKSALIREIKEECGLKVKKKHLHRIFQIHKNGRMSITYLCTKYKGKVHTNEPHIVAWKSFDVIMKGKFGKYNGLVYECLKDMGVKLLNREKLLCEIMKEDQKDGIYNIESSSSLVLCKTKGCGELAQEFSKYCVNCYNEKYKPL